MLPSSQVRGMSPIRQKFPSRSPLPIKQTSVCKIEVGAVHTLTWLEDGTTVITGLWGPGDVVGKLLSATEPYQIKCLTAVEAILSPLGSNQIPEEWLFAYLQQIEMLTFIRSHRRVDVMLVKLLGWLAKRFGHAVESGNLIDLRLTHQDLAELMGTTRVTVTRVLKQLEEQGLIERLSLQRILLKEYETWHYEI